MKLVQNLGCAEVLPPGFGVCYVIPNQDACVIAVIPLNLILRALHIAYLGCVSAWFPTRWERELDSHYKAGVQWGRDSRHDEVERLRAAKDVAVNILERQQTIISGGGK